VHLEVTPRAASVGVGQSVRFGLLVANQTETIDAYTMRIFGLDPAWVEITPARLSLFPDDVAVVDVTINLPANFPAGHRELMVHVQSQNDPAAFVTSPIALEVISQPTLEMIVDPAAVVAGTNAQFGMVILNTGNSAVHVVPDGVDPEDKAEFAFTPAGLHLLPGEQEVVRVDVRSPRPWFGQPQPKILTFGATATDRVESLATLIQKPRIGRWLLSLLGLIAAAAVFGAVLNRTFSNVVAQSELDPAIINSALASGADGGEQVPVTPASITGRVVSASGDPIAGVQAELYTATNGTVPIASAATGAEGTFAFGRLNGGDFRIRFSGAGFSTLWYPDARVFADGADIAVTLGEATALDDVTLGGEPGSVSGRVIAEDPTGATATLFIPSTVDPLNVPAVVAETDVSADGSFAFEDIPTPADYQLIVQRPGSATEQRSVLLGPGEQLTGLEIRLRPGDGVISGIVTTANGPLGGVEVVADDGVNQIRTVSLTTVNVGAFELRGLGTPGRYTVTVSRDGYSSETRSVTLDAGGQVTGQTFVLTETIGSMGGTVSQAGVGPLGGVQVTVNGPDVDYSTTTITRGLETGRWFVDSIPSPGTYTVTFSKPGFVSQVRLVDLDPFTGAIDVTGIDATLIPSAATVGGLVRTEAGLPIPGAEIALTNGTTTWNLRSADDPPGRFRISAVPPGAYTLTVTLVGAVPVVELVNVVAGEVVDREIVLSAQASVTGRVLLVQNATPTTTTTIPTTNTTTPAGVGTTVPPSTFVPILPSTTAPPASFSLEDGGRAGLPRQQANAGPYEGAYVRLYRPADFPGSAAAAIAEVRTGADGTFEFIGLEAPADFIVAVFASETAAQPLESILIETLPGERLVLPDLVITEVS
jgi:hypothetical protein